MNDPSYDFFGSGTTSSPAEPAPAPVPVRPDAVAARPGSAPQQTYATPVGRVNQFGTPVGVGTTPTGPFAAAGIGAAPTSGPGMVTTWQGPPVHARAAARAAVDPGAPRNVRAVAVFGALAGLVTVIGVSQYFAFKQLVDQTMTAETSGATSSSAVLTDSLAGTLLGVMLVGLVILATVTLVLLVGGVATLANQRWGGWMLVIAYGLYALGQLYSFAHGGYSLFGGVFALIAVVLLLVLVTGDGRRWLMSR